MGKQKKLKVSKIKRNNQIKTKLSKRGKLKTRRHKAHKKQLQKSAPPPRPETEQEEDSDNVKDLMDMIEEDDLNFLKEAISNKSYNMLKRIRLPETETSSECKNQNEQKKDKFKKDQPIEELYEQKLSEIMKEEAGKSVRMLLPIKTRDGNIKKRVNVENIY